MNSEPRQDHASSRKSLADRARETSAKIKSQLAYWKALYAHPRTPRPARILLWIAVAYLLSPIDLIPDCIPVIGYLDDLLLIPALIGLALWLIPSAVKAECRTSKDEENPSAK